MIKSKIHLVTLRLFISLFVPPLQHYSISMG